jgi:hypothetical protein
LWEVSRGLGTTTTAFAFNNGFACAGSAARTDLLQSIQQAVPGGPGSTSSLLINAPNLSVGTVHAPNGYSNFSWTADGTAKLPEAYAGFSAHQLQSAHMVRSPT